MHGIAAKLFGGTTLGIVWRENDGMDNLPGTYGEILRHAASYWEQDRKPQRFYKEGLIVETRRGALID